MTTVQTENKPKPRRKPEQKEKSDKVDSRAKDHIFKTSASKVGAKIAIKSAEKENSQEKENPTPPLQQPQLKKKDSAISEIPDSDSIKNEGLEKSEKYDKLEDSGTPLNLGQSYERPRHYRPNHWEYREVRVANVWDWAPDIWVKKWVKVFNDEEEIAPPKERENMFKVHKCKYEECGKIFYDIGSLKKHQLTHGERQFVCTVEGCGKKFLDNSKLRRHQLVHTGERPYRCELCGKTFSLDFNLRTHQRTHTGEKPYECKFPGCTKRFTQSSNLSAHEKVHYTKDLSVSQGTNNIEDFGVDDIKTEDTPSYP